MIPDLIQSQPYIKPVVYLWPPSWVAGLEPVSATRRAASPPLSSALNITQLTRKPVRFNPYVNGVSGLPVSWHYAKFKPPEIPFKPQSLDSQQKKVKLKQSILTV